MLRFVVGVLALAAGVTGQVMSPCATALCDVADPCPAPEVLSWDGQASLSIPGVVVGLRDWNDLKALRSAVAKRGGRVVGGIPQIRAAKVQGLDEAEVAALPIAKRYASRNGAFGGAHVPSDSAFGQQWHLHNIGQPHPITGTAGTPGADINVVPAWDDEMGDPSIVVAVLDSGTDFCHPELQGKQLRGYDFVSDDDFPGIEDCFGSHGLSVIGLLAASIDNPQDQGVVGVAPGISVLPIRVWQNPGVPHAGQDFDLAEGIVWAADWDCVRVINLSLGKYPWEGQGQVIEDALAYAAGKGKIIVVAAGNSELPPPDGLGPGSADLNLLAASPHTIAVGSLDHHNTLANTSSTGSALDFVAYGAGVVTVAPLSGAGTGYPSVPKVFSGTSAAAPQVSGIIALMLSKRPSLTPIQVYRYLTASSVDHVGTLPGGVLPDPGDSDGWDPRYGHGRVDAGAALLKVP